LLKYLFIKRRFNYKTTDKSFFSLYNLFGDAMKIYLEFILILNFLLDFMILYGTKRVLKLQKNLFRLILGGLIGSLTTFLLVAEIGGWCLFLLKIGLSFLIVLVAFGKNNLFENVFYFYLISIILGGGIYLFDLNTSASFYYLILLVGAPFLLFLVVKELICYRNTYSNKYEVFIYIKEKLYRMEGFIDTGNQLTSPFKGEPVILVNLELPIDTVIYVPYKALNTSGVIPCIRPDKVIINQKVFKHCLIGFSKDKFQLKGLNCILPNKFKEEL